MTGIKNPTKASSTNCHITKEYNTKSINLNFKLRNKYLDNLTDEINRVHYRVFPLQNTFICARDIWIIPTLTKPSLLTMDK